MTEDEKSAFRDRKRSSAEWEVDCEYRVIDPDGWDRSDLPASWAEPITRQEFQRRLSRSTVCHKRGYTGWNSRGEITSPD